MSVIYQLDGVKMPPIKRREVTKWIIDTASLYRKKVGEVAFVFCSDPKILEVNNQYLKHDYYTDIITFEYNEDNTINGDIFISLDTVRTNSIQFNSEYLEELYRVIIHGILHLCGINDETDAQKEQMRACENKALEYFKF